MRNFIGIISLFILLTNIGCTTIAKQLDSSWSDDRSVYEKSARLPPLEVTPELVRTAQNSTGVVPLQSSSSFKLFDKSPTKGLGLPGSKKASPLLLREPEIDDSY